MVKATQRGCIDKLIKQQILKVCKHKGTDLFNYQKDIRNNKKLVFNSNYLPNFSNLKDILNFIWPIQPSQFEVIKIVPESLAMVDTDTCGKSPSRGSGCMRLHKNMHF